MPKFYKYKQLYIESLTIVVPSTMLIGFFVKLIATEPNKRITPIESFSNAIGYSTIVIATGVTYPITYPLLGFYSLYKNNRQ